MTDYRLTLGRCPGGHRTHPARADCPACGADMTTTVEESHGTLLSWTRVDRPPEGFRGAQTVVLVRLEAMPGETHPPLVLAAWPDAQEPAVGQPVRVHEAEPGLEAHPYP